MGRRKNRPTLGSGTLGLYIDSSRRDARPSAGIRARRRHEVPAGVLRNAPRSSARPQGPLQCGITGHPASADSRFSLRIGPSGTRGSPQGIPLYPAAERPPERAHTQGGRESARTVRTRQGNRRIDAPGTGMNSEKRRSWGAPGGAPKSLLGLHIPNLALTSSSNIHTVTQR
jgi:hypothetical protein